MSQPRSIPVPDAAGLPPGSPPPGVLYGGIFLTAFATLLFEVSLIRVLSFTIWHHFGYVVISTALLGFAASGTLLAVMPRMGAHGLRRTLTRSSLLAAVTALGTLGLLCFAHLHPIRVLDEPWQSG